MLSLLRWALFALLLSLILLSSTIDAAPLLHSLASSVDSTCLIIRAVTGDTTNTKFEASLTDLSGDATILASLTKSSVGASMTIQKGSGAIDPLGNYSLSSAYSLQEGANLFRIVATAASTSTTYEFTIYKLSTNNKINFISFFDGSIDLTPAPLSSSLTSYTLSPRPSAVSSILLKSVTLASPSAQWSLSSSSGDQCTAASPSSPCIINLSNKGNDTTIKITVTPSSQTPKSVYTFSIRRQSDLALINTLAASFASRCLDIMRQGTDLSFNAAASFDADQSPSPIIYVTAKLTKATKDSGATIKIGPKDQSLAMATDNTPFFYSAVAGENKIAISVFPEDPTLQPTTYLLTVTLSSSHVAILSATVKHSISADGPEMNLLSGPATISIAGGTTEYGGMTVPSSAAFAVVRVSFQDRYASIWSGTTSGALSKCSAVTTSHISHIASHSFSHSDVAAVHAKSKYRTSALAYSTNTYKCVLPLNENGMTSSVFIRGVAADNSTKTSEYKLMIYRQSSLTKIHTLRAAFEQSCATINTTEEANHFIITSDLQQGYLFIAASLTNMTASKGANMKLTIGTAAPIMFPGNSYSPAIPVSVGKTVLIISVTAEDRMVSQDYKVTIHLRSSDNRITDAKVAIGDSVHSLTTVGVMNQQPIQSGLFDYTGIKVKSTVTSIGLKHVTLSFPAASVKLVNGSTITDCKSISMTTGRMHIRSDNPFIRHSFVPSAVSGFSYDCGVIALNAPGSSTVLRLRVIPETITPAQDYTWTVYRQSNNVDIYSLSASVAGSCLIVQKYTVPSGYPYYYKAISSVPGSAFVTVKLSNAAALSNAKYVIGPRGSTGVNASDNAISGPYMVNEGDNFIEITVTAEDSDISRTYHLDFHVLSSAATLTSGAFLQYFLVNSFVQSTTQINGATFSYPGIRLPSNAKAIRFNGLSLTNPSATANIRIQGQPNMTCTAQYQITEPMSLHHHIFATTSYPIECAAINITEGLTIVEIEVIAANANRNVYSFEIYRAYGAALKSLAVTKIDSTNLPLTPSFSPSTPHYTLSVPYAVMQVYIVAAVASPSKQSMQLNLEAYVTANATSTPLPLSVGNNVFNISVTAEDDLTAMEYSIIINRGLHINGALLSSFSLSGVDISPLFKNDTHSYTATVAASVSYFTVVAVPIDSLAKVEVSLAPQSPSYQKLNASDQYTSGPLFLAPAPSSNTLTVIVTASDGITKLSYIVVVQRSSPVSIQGDPLLTGFNGQTYNVHGIPDEYFNLVSAQNLQLNALFTFIAKDDRDKDATPAAIKSVGAWHTAGTYITDIAVRLQRDSLRITVEDSVPSAAALPAHQKLRGLVGQSGTSLTRRLVISFNGRNITDELKIGQTISVTALPSASASAAAHTPKTKHHFSIVKRSAHEFRIVTHLLVIDISRAGSHMNIEARVKEGVDVSMPSVSSRLSSMHGLLGQMWAREQKHNKKVDLSKALLLDDSDLIDGRVDDYLISDGPFGTAFAFNKFDEKHHNKELTI